MNIGSALLEKLVFQNKQKKIFHVIFQWSSFHIFIIILYINDDMLVYINLAPLPILWVFYCCDFTWERRINFSPGANIHELGFASFYDLQI